MIIENAKDDPYLTQSLSDQRLGLEQSLYSLKQLLV